MTTHKINDREYLFLEVPEGATNYRLKYEEVLHKKVLYFDLGGLTFNQFVEGVPDFEILGLASELTEEQAKELVEGEIVMEGKGGDYVNRFMYLKYGFKYANGDKGWLETAIESLHSLLTSLGLNPERTLIIERKK